MNAREIALALSVAQSDRDLSAIDDQILFGCGLPEFQPVAVSIETVAKLLRWQCRFLNGGWDWREYNENMVPIMKRKIQVAGLSRPAARALVHDIACEVLAGGAA